VRLTDRVGKGIRSSPRDAMIARAADPADRGRSFGFHQAMDHAGSAVGTLLGAALLALKLDLRTVFALAGLPGLISLVVLALVPEPVAPTKPASVVHVHAPPVALPPALYRYLAVLFVFTAANSSDAFLILKVREVGASAALAPLLWLVLHVVKAALGTLGGALSDRVSRIKMLGAGWVCYGICYALMGQARSVLQVFCIAAAYGLYSGLAEGAEKAQVADLAPREAQGRAFGLYNMVNGAGLLVAGLLFGQLWDRWGSPVAFSAAGAMALVAAALLPLVRPPRRT
jgi:MFS family permease